MSSTTYNNDTAEYIRFQFHRFTSAVMHLFQAENLSAHQQLTATLLLVIEFAGYLAHALLGTYFVWRLRNITLIHANLRIILCVKVTQYFFVAFGRTGDLLNELLDDKPLIVTNSLCLFFKFFHDAGVFISAFCPLWVAAERACATVMIKTYSDRTANVGIWIVTGTHILGFLTAIALILYDLNAGIFIVDESKFSCQFIHLHPSFFPITWLLIAVIFCVSAIILIILYRHNSRMKCLNLSTNLAARYQYSENVRTLRFLVPAFAGLGTLNLLAALSLPYIYLQFAQGASRGANIQLVYQALYLIPIGYGIFFVVYVLLKYEVLRQMLRNDVHKWCAGCCGLLSRAEAKVRPHPHVTYGHDVDRTTDIYFKQFAASWEMPKPMKKKGSRTWS